MATRSYLAQQVAVCLWRKKTGLKSQNGAFSQTLRSRMSMTDSPTPLKEGELYSKIVSTFDQKCRMCKSIRKSNASTVLKLGTIRPKIRKRKEWWTVRPRPCVLRSLLVAPGLDNLQFTSNHFYNAGTVCWIGTSGAVPICGELVLDTGGDAVYMCFPFWWLSPRLAAKCSTNNPPKRSSNPPMILIA